LGVSLASKGLALLEFPSHGYVQSSHSAPRRQMRRRLCTTAGRGSYTFLLAFSFQTRRVTMRPRCKITNILSNKSLIRYILSLNIVLYNRGCHVVYAVRLVVVVAGQTRRMTCMILPQEEEPWVPLVKQLQGTRRRTRRPTTTMTWTRGTMSLGPLSSMTLHRLILHRL